jgi:hypothetical protein
MASNTHVLAPGRLGSWLLRVQYLCEVRDGLLLEQIAGYAGRRSAGHSVKCAEPIVMHATATVPYAGQAGFALDGSVAMFYEGFTSSGATSIRVASCRTTDLVSSYHRGECGC